MPRRELQPHLAHRGRLSSPVMGSPTKAGRQAEHHGGVVGCRRQSRPARGQVLRGGGADSRQNPLLWPRPAEEDRQVPRRARESVTQNREQEGRTNALSCGGNKPACRFFYKYSFVIFITLIRSSAQKRTNYYLPTTVINYTIRLDHI